MAICIDCKAKTCGVDHQNVNQVKPKTRAVYHLNVHKVKPKYFRSTRRMLKITQFLLGGLCFGLACNYARAPKDKALNRLERPALFLATCGLTFGLISFMQIIFGALSTSLNRVPRQYLAELLFNATGFILFLLGSAVAIDRWFISDHQHAALKNVAKEWWENEAHRPIAGMIGATAFGLANSVFYLASAVLSLYGIVRTI